MKRFLLATAFTVVCSFGAFAQNQSIVGKWKLISFNSKDVNFDLDNPDAMRKDLIKQFEASGAKADSAMIEMIVKTMVESFSSMTFEFKSDGKLSMFMEGKGDKEESYTVDYEKGLIVSKSDDSTQNIYFKFDKENLVLTLKEADNKDVNMTLKKLK